MLLVVVLEVAFYTLIWLAIKIGPTEPKIALDFLFLST